MDAVGGADRDDLRRAEGAITAGMNGVEEALRLRRGIKNEHLRGDFRGADEAVEGIRGDVEEVAGPDVDNTRVEGEPKRPRGDVVGLAPRMPMGRRPSPGGDGDVHQRPGPTDERSRPDEADTGAEHREGRRIFRATEVKRLLGHGFFSQAKGDDDGNVILYDIRSCYRKGMRTSPDRTSEQTRLTLLAAAIAELEAGSVETLTMRAVAARAGTAERTVFRYFATREAFLDGVTEAVTETLHLPPVPTEPAGLVGYVASIYARFEARGALTRAALHPEIFQRMVETASKERWRATERCIDGAFPDVPVEERRVAAANIRYFLSATTWNYYRTLFGFTLEETTLAAQTMIRQALAALRAPSVSTTRR